MKPEWASSPLVRRHNSAVKKTAGKPKIDKELEVSDPLQQLAFVVSIRKKLVRR
jgi:hypothetical protein